MEKFTIQTLQKSNNPQQLIWLAMHQDYCEDLVCEEIKKKEIPSEEKAGEIVVKHLLAGNRGHYGCYDEKTEVLTSKGWLNWTKVNPDTELAAINIKTRKTHFEKPLNLQVYDHNGSMYRVTGKEIDILVTFDHRMVISRPFKNSWSDLKFETARQVMSSTCRYLVNGELSNTTPYKNPWAIEPTRFAGLLGLYLATGEVKTDDEIKIGKAGQGKRQYQKSFIESLAIKGLSADGQNYRVTLPGLGKWLLNNCALNESKDNLDKTIPTDFLKTTKDEMFSFLAGLNGGTSHDFHVQIPSEQLVDKVQALMHLNGLSSTLTLERHKNPKYDRLWKLKLKQESFVEIDFRRPEREQTEEIVDYTGKIYCATVSTGALIVRREKKVVVCGNCLEHPAITVNVGYFPHSVMQQIRTHRVGISFDCQSMRYTGKRLIEVVNAERDIEDVFYLRPVGEYTDRQGKKYKYSLEQREEDLNRCIEACLLYKKRIGEGLSEEQARSTIPFDFRQHFVMSCNMRSLMHLLDLRWKKDAQLEAQIFSDHLYGIFASWAPAIAKWYKDNRAKKARLSP